MKLRTLFEQVQAGRQTEPLAVSAELTRLVQALFAAVQDAPSGNPFSNANRAVDHLLAYGRAWRQHPLPLLVSGSRLPEALIAKVESLLEAAHLLPDQGYLAG